MFYEMEACTRVKSCQNRKLNLKSRFIHSCRTNLKEDHNFNLTWLLLFKNNDKNWYLMYFFLKITAVMVMCGCLLDQKPSLCLNFFSFAQLPSYTQVRFVKGQKIKFKIQNRKSLFCSSDRFFCTGVSTSI